MPKKEPLYRDQQPRRADRNLLAQLESEFLRRPPAFVQPDSEPPAVPAFTTATFTSGIDTQATAVRAYVSITWTRNSELDCMGYRLRYRAYLLAGEGVVSGNVLTVTTCLSATGNMTAHAYIGCILVDEDGSEFAITDNTTSTITFTEAAGVTAAEGSFSVVAPWTTLWVPQVATGSDVTATLRDMRVDTVYDFSAEAVDLWNNASGYSANVAYITPTWSVELNAPLNCTTDFDGRNCEVYWEAPAEAGPEQDYKVEVRDYEAGSILQTYYVDATHFTLTYEENVRIHTPNAPSFGLHFSVYTHDVLGNTSAGATSTATNARPASPSNLDTDATRADFTIEYDTSSEHDITHYEFEVVVGTG